MLKKIKQLWIRSRAIKKTMARPLTHQVLSMAKTLTDYHIHLPFKHIKHSKKVGELGRVTDIDGELGREGNLAGGIGGSAVVRGWGRQVAED